MHKPSAAGGWPAIWYTLRQAHRAGGALRMLRALRPRNACKTCALGMGGQAGGMVNERGHFPEVCKNLLPPGVRRRLEVRHGLRHRHDLAR